MMGDDDLPGFSDAEIEEQIAPWLAEVDADYAAQLPVLVEVFRRKGPPRRYPVPKQRELSSEEKARLRERIEAGDGDIYRLAAEFGCSPSQVAGVKAALHR